ncbi:MAG: hypothetical protein HYW48_10775 [Deltaproteobacteria bacterium]|nr:hypothetical protein [Deltaproteobacteria bacterium]
MKILQSMPLFIAICFAPAIQADQASIANCTQERIEKGESSRLIFADRQKPVVLEEELQRIRFGYIKYVGKMQIPGEDSISFDYQYYQTTLVNPGEKAPLVFLYANIYGITPLEQSIAHYFTHRGISVVVSHYMDETNMYVLENYILSLLNTVRVSLALVDHFSERQDVDSSQMGAVGASYGGIRSLYHMAMDARIKAGVLMVAGAPVEEVMAHSELPTVIQIRHRQMQSAGISTIEDYLKILRSQIIVDIGDLLCQRKTEDFYLFIAKNDRFVHSRYQWNLWDILDHPKHESRPYGHAGTAIWASFKYLGKARRFLQSRWQERVELSDSDSSTEEMSQ